MTDKDVQALVVDNGTGMCKAGFAGEWEPGQYIETVIGVVKSTESHVPQIGLTESNQSRKYVGEDALRHRRGFLNLTYPIEHGVIKNWDDMELIWRQILEYHAVTDSEGDKWSFDYHEVYQQPVFMTESPLNPRQNRERTTQIMFETFNVCGFYLMSTSVLSLIAATADSSKVSTGCVVECGAGVTHSVPTLLDDGVYTLTPKVRQLEVGGSDVTQQLMDLISRENGMLMHSAHSRHAMRGVKEGLCFVTRDPDNDHAGQTSFTLPDDKTIRVRDERFQAPEILFQPNRVGRGQIGVDKLTHEAIQACTHDLHKAMYANIVLSGGSTMLPGFVERMVMELTSLAPESTELKIIAPPDRANLAWLGGSMVASQSEMKNMWITKAEYDEYGPNLVNTRCVH